MVKFRSSRHQRGGWKGGVRFTPVRTDSSTAANACKSDANDSANSKTGSNANTTQDANHPVVANGEDDSATSERAKSALAKGRLRPRSFWTIPIEPDNTFRIPYKGICGLNHPGVNGGDGVCFEFEERVPCYLCFRTPGIPAQMNCNETGKYIAGVVSRHNARIMETRVWECQFCGQVAHEMCHAPIPFFNPAIGDTSDFRPSIWDFVVPICRSLSECDVKAENLIVKLAKKYFPGPVIVSGPSCQGCGSMNHLMTCGGCSRVKYCSKRCQTQDWSKHKKNCRFSQRETAKKDTIGKPMAKMERPTKGKSRNKNKSPSNQGIL